MIFKPTSRLLWESINSHGVAVKVSITEEGKALLSSSVESKEFDHPIEAMNYSASLKGDQHVAKEEKAPAAEGSTQGKPTGQAQQHVDVQAATVFSDF